MNHVIKLRVALKRHRAARKKACPPWNLKPVRRFLVKPGFVNTPPTMKV